MHDTAGQESSGDLMPGAVLGRYRLLEPLGTGGLAVVYRARHETLGSEHALKMLRVATPSIQRRLVNEGRVQARLRHPNVVTVHDVLESPQGPVLVMDIVDGPALDEWLAENEPTLEQALRLFRDIVAGVAAAHAHGVVHRDLKPANILLQGAELTARVTDFGLAKALQVDGFGDNRKATRPGVTMGTPAYMAPEQIRDAKTVDERADLFSLGCILYELMCGRPAFTGEDNMEIFSAVSLSDYPRPQSVVPGLPNSVRDAIEGLLQADANDRIPDCQTLLTVLDGEPWFPKPRTDHAATWQETPAPSISRLSQSSQASQPPGVRGWTAPDRSHSSHAGRTHKTWAIALVGVGMVGSLTMGGATIVGFYGAETSASQRVAADLAERFEQPVVFSDARVAPNEVALMNVVVGDPARPVLTAGELTVSMGALDVFTADAVPESLVLSDVVVDIGTLSGRSGVRTMTRSLAGESPMRIDGLTLSGGNGPTAWQFEAEQIDWEPGIGWTATAWTLDDSLRGQQMRWEPSGTLSVQSFDLGSGGLDAVRTGALGTALPRWMGGHASHDAWRSWGEQLSELLPGDVNQVDIEGGRLDLGGGDVALVRATVGPTVGGYTPMSVLLTDDLGRVSFSGESTPNGNVLGQVEARRMPLDHLAEGLNERFAASEVVLASGRVDADIEFSVTNTAVEYVADARFYDVAFRGEAFGMSATKGAVVGEWQRSVPHSNAYEHSLASLYSSIYSTLVLGEVAAD